MLTVTSVYQCECFGDIFESEDGWTPLTIFRFISITLGMFLSIIALILLLVTSYLFTEWRRNCKNQVLIQFMIARFLYTVIRYCYDVLKLCTWDLPFTIQRHADLMLFMYTEATLTLWMFIFSKQMYQNFVKVFKVREGVLKVSLFAWIFPSIVVLLYCSCVLYFDKLMEYLIIYFVLIRWPLLTANAVLLVMVLRAILYRKMNKPDSNTRIITVMVTLLFSFCVQQVIGDIYKILFSLNQQDQFTTMYFLVAVVTVYHCAFSIFFWLFGNKKTVKLWKFRRMSLKK